MSTTPATHLCRITVVAPTTFADLAVPVDTPVAELLPAIMQYCNDDGLDGEPMVLQLLGGPPLPPDATLASSDVYDGQTLYLRPRADPIPAMVFDDLIDGVGGVVAGGSQRWSAAATGSLYTLLAGVALAFGVFVLLWPGPSVVGLITAAISSLLLMIIASLSATSFDLPANAMVSAWFGVAFATVAGMMMPVVSTSAVSEGATTIRGWALLPEVLVAGSATLAVAALVGALAVDEAVGGFTAAGTLGLGGMAIGMFEVWGDWDLVDAASAAAATCILLGPVLPSLAYRLARIRPPHLPTEPGDLQADIVDPLAGELVTERAVLANEMLTGLLIGTSLVVGFSFPLISGESGVFSTVLTALMIAILLLRSRVLTENRQRLAVVLAGWAGILAFAWRFLAAIVQDLRPAVAMAATIVASTVLLFAAAAMPGTRLSPYWGRSADILETLLAAALLPVLFGSLGVYATARAIAG